MTGYPAIDVIIERAHRYYQEYYARNGVPPDRFLVTERDYHLLQIFPDGRFRYSVHSDDMQIFGMRIVKPERIAWYGANPSMDHIRLTILRPISPHESMPSMNTMIEHCRTELPTEPQPEICCPCGEVIWDLRTAVWRVSGEWEVDLIGARETVRVVDSDTSTLNEWVAGVDVLVADVRGHRS